MMEYLGYMVLLYVGTALVRQLDREPVPVIPICRGREGVAALAIRQYVQ